ncbi:thioredoxin-disulfide reductase [Bowdeniella nasicola]|uniref:Thioredoxin reductase n=1 Tax=Bowdeniella nasicola TaxID=208480 RepID=A0A1Q5Q2H4_9ACTO|nr:thioredoxin-disulfide reductase [Bowdeniella nasicola]OKL54054.1 thioredoxin-disulfide reductase [Bowdeniella nasicola]
MTNSLHDVIVVGSGPAGYTAAIYAARAGLKPVVFAGAISAGGALMTTTEVENFPGFSEGVQGPDLMENMRGQAERFGAEIRFEDIVSVDLSGETKTVTNDDDETFSAKSVILALGSEYKKLGIPDEDRLSGRGVSWCATCDGFFFRDKEIVVVGGGDSAMQEATFLTRFASKVTVIHRRDELRASKIMAERAMNDPKIEFAWNSSPVGLVGEDKLEGVIVEDTVTGEKRTIDASGMFIAIGHAPRTDIVTGQVNLDDDGYILVDSPSTKTNIDGVFACGDVVDHTYRQAITAAGTGCAAALDAERYLVALSDSDVDEKITESWN